MKTAKEIRIEAPYYFVSIEGTNEFESFDLEACKEFLINYLSKHSKEIEETYRYFIGMYNIDIE